MVERLDCFDRNRYKKNSMGMAEAICIEFFFGKVKLLF